MFLFGLFSTNIPYIILACLYAVGFGVYSGNSIKEKLFHKSEELVLVLVQKQQPVSTITSFHYYNKLTVKKQSTESQKFCQFSNALPDIIQICHTDPIKIDAYLQTNNFSRPPPLS